jgi:hypothetical protein
VYAASEGLKTILIERHAVGGQAGSSSLNSYFIHAFRETTGQTPHQTSQRP